MDKVIPTMPHNYIGLWQQPRYEELYFPDDESVIVSRNVFNKLMEYSTTMPTGVYPGKMWRAEINGVHYLRWYGLHATEPERLCTNNQRLLLIDDIGVVALLSGEDETS